jgi:hypothetical protein
MRDGGGQTIRRGLVGGTLALFPGIVIILPSQSVICRMFCGIRSDFARNCEKSWFRLKSAR